MVGEEEEVVVVVVATVGCPVVKVTRHCGIVVEVLVLAVGDVDGELPEVGGEASSEGDVEVPDDLGVGDVAVCESDSVAAGGSGWATERVALVVRVVARGCACVPVVVAMCVTDWDTLPTRSLFFVCRTSSLNTLRGLLSSLSFESWLSRCDDTLARTCDPLRMVMRIGVMGGARVGASAASLSVEVLDDSSWESCEELLSPPPLTPPPLPSSGLGVEGNCCFWLVAVVVGS